MTETWCDQVNDRIRRETEKDGLFIRPRYSPGYGDLSLTVQTDISRILNMPKEIGVSLTDTLLMTPSKSVTALIGVAKTPADCHKSGCAACSAASTCPYRA
jgi:cobalamin-dependent methionine synthase I